MSTPASTSVSGRILAVKADGSGAQRVVVPEASLGRAARPLALAADGRTALQIVDERGHGRLRVADVRPDGSLGPLRPILRIEPDLMSCAGAALILAGSTAVVGYKIIENKRQEKKKAKKNALLKASERPTK